MSTVTTMISAEEARRIYRSAIDIEAIALTALSEYVAAAAAEGFLSLQAAAVGVPKTEEFLKQLTDLGYKVETLDTANGNWQLNLSWEESNG